MKLNGLTNNLKGNDQSLSNSYLQHIVELLRKEVETLEQKESSLETAFNEHDETQKVLVETETVKANSIEVATVNTTAIKNGTTEIDILKSAIEVFGKLKVNGKEVLTESTFEGPFTYKGIVETLPENANAGDVYICENKVNIYNGTTFDEFIMPVGTISKAEYEEDRAEMLVSIQETQTKTETTSADLAIFKTDTQAAFVTVGTEIGAIKNDLEDKVEEAPEDEKSYVRKDGEWVEQSVAANTVKAHIGNSYIESDEEHIEVGADRMDIYSDVYINDHKLPEINKFSLTKTNKSEDTTTWYTYDFGRSPYCSCADSVYASYNTGDRLFSKQNINQQYYVATRDYSYLKTCSNATWADGGNFRVTSMDKNGNIKNLYNPGATQDESTMVVPEQTGMMVWNPEFCPEGYENKMYMLYLGQYYISNRQATLIEYDNGEYVASYDLTEQLGEDYTNTGAMFSSTGWAYLTTCGKALRNKNVERICFIAITESGGGNVAVILGGNESSNLNDPFDPTKAMYIKLPAVAKFGYANMAATDSAWYLTEDTTGRIMRITPNGRVTEYNLSMTTYKTAEYNYIEYTDKNGRPACAYNFFVNSSGGKICTAFLEEKEDGGVNFIERDMAPYVYTDWSSALWRFIENDYYIFYTSFTGWAHASNYGYDSAANHQKLFYFDKKTLTLHTIDDLMSTEATWTYARIDLSKTKDGAIWCVPYWSAQTDTQRTGVLKYISNIDYTNIDEETNTDIGSIEVQTANIGTDYPWGIFNNTYGWYNYPVELTDTSGWAYARFPVKLHAVNDDGILCLVSPDFKAYALCYGDGNVKVYKNGDQGKNGKYYPGVQQFTSGEMVANSSSMHALIPMQHGWLLELYQNDGATSSIGTARTSYSYIGIKYRNGEPTILERPVLNNHMNEQLEDCMTKAWYNYYGYLLTYDDYERRKKILRGIYRDFRWGNAYIDASGYWKETEHNAVKKLNLAYDGTVISSVEE